MPSLERLDESFMPSLEELDEPFDEALRPSRPERSCELLRPELVLPEAPRPSLRLELELEPERELLLSLEVPLRLVPEAL